MHGKSIFSKFATVLSLIAIFYNIAKSLFLSSSVQIGGAVTLLVLKGVLVSGETIR